MYLRGRPYDPEQFREAAQRHVDSDADYIVQAADELLTNDKRPANTDIAAVCTPELDAYSASPATLLYVAMHGTQPHRANASAHFFDMLIPYLKAAVEKKAEYMCEAANLKREAEEFSAYCEAADARDYARRFG